MEYHFEEFARAGRVVVFAGAGVSAGKPSALPGWRQLNEEIVGALRTRLETAVERQDWLRDVALRVGGLRDAGQFPPDCQAQIIEEMCGDRYFRALQALDVDLVNGGHEGIAAMAEASALRAVVTTNFDRLTEIALERCGVEYEAVFDDAGFRRMSERTAAGPLPVIKIHGSVSDHRSMIDTLKQRKRGRSDALESCLERLFGEYWLYLGFSAADLETDARYLGLIAGAARSVGATYVKYPPQPELGPGAQALMAAYGERGSVVTAEIAEVLGVAAGNGEAVGPALVSTGLAKWAGELSVAAAGLCLAAILEAAGEGEAGVRVLDRLVRKDIGGTERESADYRALQLHYGRLGAAFGRFIRVPDLNGAMSNASEETGQSLMRLQDTEYGFAARNWLGCFFLWMGMGEAATQSGARVLLGFAEGDWRGPGPGSDEEAVDAWLAASQIFILNTHSKTMWLVAKTFPDALGRARRSGDVVRAARVAALYLLACAERVEDVPAISREWDSVFDDARRVGDGFAAGFRALAMGRWHVGGGGLALAKGEGPAVAARAMAYLEEATRWFERQGMDPWRVFTGIQRTKALMDLGRYEELDPAVSALEKELDRFPILASHLYEAVCQMERAFKKADAEVWCRRALECAKESGLEWRVKFLEELAARDPSNPSSSVASLI